MKVLLAVALAAQVAFGAAVIATSIAQTLQITQWTDAARQLSQENSNLSARTFDLIAITNPTSQSEAATKFAVALCAQDAQGTLDTLDPKIAQAVADEAAYYSITPADVAAQFVTLPAGTRCTNVVYSGGFLNDSGQYAAIFILVYTDGEKTWSQFWVVAVADGLVDGIE